MKVKNLLLSTNQNVINNMHIEALSLRYIDQTLSLRNNSDVRKYFLNDSIVSKESHYKWYGNYLKKDGDLVVIGVNDYDKVCFQFSLYDFNQNENSIQFGRFFIAPTLRKRGLGKKVMNYAINMCRGSRNLRRVWLSVKSENESAFSIYTKFGFQVYKTIGLPGSEILFMELRL